ncbi:MAG: hypothetical protein PHQ18_04830 [Patescibacteria group bacterium]|nr:hypothetical protein [Patescibacteria group bacterium]
MKKVNLTYKIFILVSLCLFFTMPALADNNNTDPVFKISGIEIPNTGDIDLSTVNNPYVVKSDLNLYHGQNIKIEKGVVVYFGQDKGICLSGGICIKYGWPGHVPDLAGKKITFTKDVNITVDNNFGDISYKIVSHAIKGERPQGEKGITQGTRSIPLSIENKSQINEINFLIDSDWFSTFYDTEIFDEYWGWNMTLFVNPSTPVTNNSNSTTPDITESKDVTELPVTNSSEIPTIPSQNYNKPVENISEISQEEVITYEDKQEKQTVDTVNEPVIIEQETSEIKNTNLNQIKNVSTSIKIESGQQKSVIQEDTKQSDTPQQIEEPAQKHNFIVKVFYKIKNFFSGWFK